MIDRCKLDALRSKGFRQPFIFYLQVGMLSLELKESGLGRILEFSAKTLTEVIPRPNLAGDFVRRSELVKNFMISEIIIIIYC